MRAKSVRKKLKNKKFAAAVSREDITTGIDELGVELSEHIDRCIDAISAAGINIHTQESC
jgi:predicted hydrolase (HD superfamily)